MVLVQDGYLKDKAAYSHGLLEKGKPWSCDVDNLSKYQLKDLVINANTGIEEGTVASFMNRAFGYDSYTVEVDLDGYYLLGNLDSKQDAIAMVYNDFEYNRIKDKIYEEWLKEPLKKC